MNEVASNATAHDRPSDETVRLVAWRTIRYMEGWISAALGLALGFVLVCWQLRLSLFSPSAEDLWHSIFLAMAVLAVIDVLMQKERRTGEVFFLGNVPDRRMHRRIRGWVYLGCYMCLGLGLALILMMIVPADERAMLVLLGSIAGMGATAFAVAMLELQFGKEKELAAFVGVVLVGAVMAKSSWLEFRHSEFLFIYLFVGAVIGWDLAQVLSGRPTCSWQSKVESLSSSFLPLKIAGAFIGVAVVLALGEIVQ